VLGVPIYQLIGRRVQDDLVEVGLSSERALDVLRLVETTGHSAYDCEYVALTQRLGVVLVTGDKRLPVSFPIIWPSQN
jgi:predicted nucleic acid-binding protein